MLPYKTVTKIFEDLRFDLRLKKQDIENQIMKTMNQQTPERIGERVSRLTVEWMDEEGAEVMSPNLHRSISTTQSEFRCPHCKSIIYSRRNKLCGACGQTLPAELLFSPEEARRIEKLLLSEKLRRKIQTEKSFKSATSVF